MVLSYIVSVTAVDHRIIWESPTESSIASALSYYHDRMESATWLNAVLAGIAGVSIASTVVKIASDTTSTMLFDGGSLCELAGFLSRLTSQRAFKRVLILIV